MKLSKILTRHAHWVCRHPLPVILFTLVLTMVMAWFASQLKGNFNILNLLPAKAPQVVQLRELLDEFGGEDRLLLAMEPCTNGCEDCSAFRDGLLDTLRKRDALREEPFFKNLKTFATDDRDWMLEFIFDNGVYFLDEAGIDKCLERLSSKGIKAVVAEDRVLIKSPAGQIRVKRDPLNLSAIFLKAVPPRFRNIRTSSFRESPDGSLMLIELQPVKPPQDGESSRQVVAFCNQTVAEIQAGFDCMPKVHIIGGYALAAADTTRIMGVIFRTFLVSLGIVALMLFVAFKEMRVLVFIVPGLAMAILWTAGLARLLFGEITIVSAAFAAVLIGLGVDFAIHIYNRFRIEIENGHNPVAAMAITQGQTGTAVLSGAITTASAFFILSMSDFPGVQQFGILVGSGVLICAVIYFTGFSAVLVLQARRGRSRTFTREFGLRRLYTYLRRAPGVVMILFALLTIGALIYLLTGQQLAFENDFRNLRPKDDPFMAANQRYAERLGMSLFLFPVMVKADSFNDFVNRNIAVAQGMKRLQDEGIISAYLSAGDLFKNRGSQQNNLDRLAQVDFERVAADLRRELRRNRFKPDGFKDTFAFLARLQRRVRERTLFDPRVLEDPRIKRATASFLKIDTANASFKSVSGFYTAPGEERDFDIAYVKKAIGSDEKNVFATGMNIICRAVVHTMATWMALMIPIVISVIMVLLYVNFRSVRYALMAAAPLAIGVTLMLASMKALGFKFNVMNFGIIPMIIGIGVDNGIHIIRGYLDASEDEFAVRDAVSITGRAVIMTSLTTVAGFGSLILGEYQGIISMGVMAGFGVAFCLFATVCFVPAALLRFGKRREGGSVGGE